MLRGTINTTIEYNPIGAGERVYLDGRLIVTTPGNGWHLVQPRVDFYLEAFDHRVPARIDVRASLLFFKTFAFRLSVAGNTVYDETVL